MSWAALKTEALFCFRATFLVAKTLSIQNRHFCAKSSRPWLMLPDVKWNCGASGQNLPHYLPDKSQTLRGDRGSPHSPNERGEVCANCPWDPYLSPAIKPISPTSLTLVFRISSAGAKCYSYFSAGSRSICSDTIPSLTSGEAGANIFLLLICFSRTLLHPINLPLWKDRIRPWHGSTPRLGFRTVTEAAVRFGKINSHFWSIIFVVLHCPSFVDI